METLKNVIMYFLSFQTFVVLPVIIFILAMIFRIKPVTALKSALTIGIGFVGIFMVFDYFVKIIQPVITALINRSGLHLNVLDTGWPPLAAITWSFSLVPVLIMIFIIINLAMLFFKLTKSVDIDIWNYWHVLLAAVMIYQVTGNAFVTIGAASLTFILMLKLSDWSAPLTHKLSGMNGICIPHLAAVTYFPIALVANRLLDKIPGFNQLNADPEKIRQKMGLIGEPMILGLVMGLILGICGGYNIKQNTELAMGFAAVMYILPKMCGILGSGLVPVAEGMKEFIKDHFPNMGETYIGLDVAVLFGVPSIFVTAILLIPVALLLAFILPGIRFIPLGDLTNLLVPVALITVATQGNIIRSFILGVPAVIANLYIASSMADFFTKMADSAHYQIPNYHGAFTSFLDGGQFFRAWLVQVFSGNLISLLFIPVGIAIFYWAWRIVTQEDAKQVKSESSYLNIKSN
jgi:PTS system galactitol-specific IIC component